jgi:hypothetical protein
MKPTYKQTPFEVLHLLERGFIAEINDFRIYGLQRRQKENNLVSNLSTLNNLPIKG